MQNASGTPSASGISYPYTVQQFESLDEAREAMGDEGILENLNSLQDQNAKQGPKGEVREAIDEAEEAGWDDEAIQSAVDEMDGGGDEALEGVVSAVEHAQEVTAGYVLGRPRGRTDGVTKTKAREIGEGLRERLSEEELLALAEEHGISVE